MAQDNDSEAKEPTSRKQSKPGVCCSQRLSCSSRLRPSSRLQRILHRTSLQWLLQKQQSSPRRVRAQCSLPFALAHSLRCVPRAFLPTFVWSSLTRCRSCSSETPCQGGVRVGPSHSWLRTARSAALTARQRLGGALPLHKTKAPRPSLPPERWASQQAVTCDRDDQAWGTATITVAAIAYKQYGACVYISYTDSALLAQWNPQTSPGLVVRRRVVWRVHVFP